VSAAVPACVVADAPKNAQGTIELFERSHAQGDALVVFPELGLTSYTARDLFHNSHLLAEAETALSALVKRSNTLHPVALVGLPVRVGLGVYNVAVAIAHGEILAVIPKAYLPTYREFEEKRWFRSGLEVAPGSMIELLGQTVPFGMDILLAASEVPDLVIGIEICEDGWVQVPPSMLQTSAGATIVANLSASNFTIGKAELRRLLFRSASDRGKCGYIYVAAGPGESSTDLAFDADAFICENGNLLVESQRFARTGQLITQDLDLASLVHERITTTSFGDCAHQHHRTYRKVAFHAESGIRTPLRRQVAKHPFVPSDARTLGARCWEIFEIQTNALATRMQTIGQPKLVLGISGGLDSTQAALAAAGALDLLGRPRTDLHCVTMPGLGTTAGTRSSAAKLAVQLGATFAEIPIREASRLVLSMIQHPAMSATVEDLLAKLAASPELGDVTLENVQARLRTLVLMSVANQVGGIVLGTGDLSEKALGWSTYAGDHIAMYDVNAGIPKTLIQSVVRWVANERVRTWSVGDPTHLRETLFAILETPISPELLPSSPDGTIAQLTESTIGPYELHDFFLYEVVRHGSRPRRILDVAHVAFGDRYDLATLKRWLTVFVRRFFTQQFKRSCTADAPKIGQVALSPRGDWRMPSDASAKSWLLEIEHYA